MLWFFNIQVSDYEHAKKAHISNISHYLVPRKAPTDLLKVLALQRLYSCFEEKDVKLVDREIQETSKKMGDIRAEACAYNAVPSRAISRVKFLHSVKYICQNSEAVDVILKLSTSHNFTTKFRVSLVRCFTLVCNNPKLERKKNCLMNMMIASSLKYGHVG